LLYAALVPFPNEAILIPLAISGIKFRYLVAPLLIGNMLHQAILIVGVDSLTRFVF
jgi:membrane protein YqaA with SNARE-associated domain